RLVGQLEARAVHALRVARRELAVAVGPSGDVPELHAEDGGVDVVEAAVVAHAVDGPHGRAVVAQPAHGGVDVVAVRDHGAAAPEGAQVLLDDEARAHGVAQLALLPAGTVAVD